MGIEAFVSKPNTSKSNKANHIDPYLQVTEVDEVWYADITYIPMQKGHTYLITIMAWHSRVMSNTIDSIFYVKALKKAMNLTGHNPEIFNTDQDSQFSSTE